MKKYKWILLIVNLMVLLVYFNWSVFQKEAIGKEGKLFFLELIQSNGKSLMQGDYMRLQYKVQDSLKKALWPAHGMVIVQVDTNSIIQTVSLQDNTIPTKETEYAIEFNRTKFQLSIGAEAFFIQEGYHKKYEAAKYAGIRVDEKGHSLLIGLYNEQLKLIQ